jgi:hypothetical protein
MILAPGRSRWLHGCSSSGKFVQLLVTARKLSREHFRDRSKNALLRNTIS